LSSDFGEHFGWLDDDHDGYVTEAEWNKARSLRSGEFGAIAFGAGEAAWPIAIVRGALAV
jgi:hypothetical protein